MESTIKKTTQIMNELTLYFFRMGTDHVQADLRRTPDCYLLTMESAYGKEHHKQVRDLDRFLNLRSRNEGIEDVYGGLAGMGDTNGDTELYLIGQMIDEFRLDVGEETVRLEIKKYFEDRWL